MSNLYRAPKDTPMLLLYETVEMAHKVALPNGPTEDETYFLSKFWSIDTKTKVLCSNPSDIFFLLDKEIDGKCEYWNVLVGEKIWWLCVPLWTKMEQVIITK